MVRLVLYIVALMFNVAGLRVSWVSVCVCVWGGVLLRYLRLQWLCKPNSTQEWGREGMERHCLTHTHTDCWDAGFSILTPLAVTASSASSQPATSRHGEEPLGSHCNGKHCSVSLPPPPSPSPPLPLFQWHWKVTRLVSENLCFSRKISDIKALLVLSY